MGERVNVNDPDGTEVTYEVLFTMQVEGEPSMRLAPVHGGEHRTITRAEFEGLVAELKARPTPV